jgi:hypothetical protein
VGGQIIFGERLFFFGEPPIYQVGGKTGDERRQTKRERQEVLTKKL